MGGGGLRAGVLRELLVGDGGALGRLEVVERIGSTNSELAAAVGRDPAAWPGVSMLVAEHQDDGRGRTGRTWQTPPRAALTLSISLWPTSPPAAIGWFPLLAGLGAVHALRATTGVQVTLKWPNDLLAPAPDGAQLDGWGPRRKVGGILSELVPTSRGPAVILGIGINVSQSEADLPVPSAISLAGAGARDLDREVILVALVSALVDLAGRLDAAHGDAVAAGLADEVAAACTTIGLAVRVELPGGGALEGTALGLGPDGSLLVRGAGGATRAVLAGDVLHVREPSAG